jgi:hypothetical protein
MSYCTVQEAWGTDFGRTRGNNMFKTPSDNTQENFSSNYSDDNTSGNHSSVNFPQKEYRATGYHDPIERQKYTLGKSNNKNGAPNGYAESTFYPVDSDAGKDHVLNYSYDYAEEDQLNGNKTPQQCNGAFKHLTECKECRQKLITSIERTTAQQPEPSSPLIPSFDATELALFIACGVFFIFLFDAIVKLTQRIQFK